MLFELAPLSAPHWFAQEWGSRRIPIGARLHFLLYLGSLGSMASIEWETGESGQMAMQGEDCSRCSSDGLRAIRRQPNMV